jgi:hypothetical protein
MLPQNGSFQMQNAGDLIEGMAGVQRYRGVPQGIGDTSEPWTAGAPFFELPLNGSHLGWELRLVL